MRRQENAHRLPGSLWICGSRGGMASTISVLSGPIAPFRGPFQKATVIAAKLFIHPDQIARAFRSAHLKILDSPCSAIVVMVG